MIVEPINIPPAPPGVHVGVRVPVPPPHARVSYFQAVGTGGIAAPRTQWHGLHSMTGCLRSPLTRYLRLRRQAAFMSVGALVQANLKIGGVKLSTKITGAPFNVELPGSARYP